MVDNVTIPAQGTGTSTPSVATDDVSGQHYQRMKISNGEADSATHLGVYAEDEAHAGGDTGILSLALRADTPANISGADQDYEILQMSGGFLWTRNRIVGARLTTDITRPGDATPYAVNDALSDSTSAPTSGGFTWSNAARVSGGAGKIISYYVSTTADASTLLVGEIWVFTTSVTNINDNTAFAVSDTEIKTCVGKLPFALEDAGNNGWYGASNVMMKYTTSGSANLRFLIRVKNAYTPTNPETLTFGCEVEYLD